MPLTALEDPVVGEQSSGEGWGTGDRLQRCSAQASWGAAPLLHESLAIPMTCLMAFEYLNRSSGNCVSHR